MDIQEERTKLNALTMALVCTKKVMGKGSGAYCILEKMKNEQRQKLLDHLRSKRV